MCSAAQYSQPYKLKIVVGSVVPKSGDYFQV